MMADATTGTKAGFEKEYQPLIESVSYKPQQLSRNLKDISGDSARIHGANHQQTECFGSWS